jgi:hypothetical protein
VYYRVASIQLPIGASTWDKTEIQSKTNALNTSLESTVDI